MKLFYSYSIPLKYLNRSARDPLPDSKVCGMGPVETICCNCERAVRGRCPWRERFEPYPGWTAVQHTMANGVVSYQVQDCPGYVETWEEVRVIRKSGKAKDLLVRAVKIKPEHLDDAACVVLLQRVLYEAKKDYMLFPDQRESISRFIRSHPYIADPDHVLKWLRDMARIYDLNPKLRKRLMNGDDRMDGYVPPKLRAKRSSRWIVFNQYEPTEFAECQRCGYEKEKPYPRICPGCGALMCGTEAAEEKE